MVNIIYSLISRSLLDATVACDIFKRSDISSIIVIDDETSKNNLFKSAFFFSIGSSYDLEIVAKEEALELLKSSKYKNQRIGLTSRTLSNFIYLHDRGINLGDILLTDEVKLVFEKQVDMEEHRIEYLKNQGYAPYILRNTRSKKIIL